MWNKAIYDENNNQVSSAFKAHYVNNSAKSYRIINIIAN